MIGSLFFNGACSSLSVPSATNSECVPVCVHLAQLCATKKLAPTRAHTRARKQVCQCMHSVKQVCTMGSRARVACECACHEVHV